MNIKEAAEKSLQEGKEITRKAWNRKGQYAVKVSLDCYTMVCKTSIPWWVPKAQDLIAEDWEVCEEKKEDWEVCAEKPEDPEERNDTN